jgi:hypothetical protein
MRFIKKWFSNTKIYHKKHNKNNYPKPQNHLFKKLSVDEFSQGFFTPKTPLSPPPKKASRRKPF